MGGTSRESTVVPVDTDDLLPQLVARRAVEQADGVLLRNVDGSTLSYRDLYESSCLWAAAFQRLGVTTGENVAVLSPMCLDYYRSWLGLAWLKAVQAPLNTDYRAQLLVHAITTANARVVVSSRRLVDRIAEVAAQLHRELTVVVFDDDRPATDLPFTVVGRAEFLNGIDPLHEPDGPNPWDVATLLYTSGSTGPSKAVVVPWGQLHRTASNTNRLYEAQERDVFYAPSPTYHVGAVALPFGAALVGAEVVVRERFSASEWWEDVATFRCTLASFLGALVAFATGARSRPTADNTLRRVLMAPVLADVEEFQERFGVTVATAYNMTELSCPISTAGIEITNATHLISGQLQPGYEARIVDAHDMEVPNGTVGELIIRADDPWTLNLGYYGMPEKTVEAWRNGWFHTGDALRRDDDGNFYFVDRLKDSIRRRGENISSFEVEAVVLGHPEVRECAAVAVPSEISEDEVKVVIAREEGSELEPRTLIEWLVPRMPRFMIPRYVEFVDGLPKTPTDRIQKAVLREQGVTETTWDRERAGVEVPR